MTKSAAKFAAEPEGALEVSLTRRPMWNVYALRTVHAQLVPWSPAKTNRIT